MINRPLRNIQNFFRFFFNLSLSFSSFACSLFVGVEDFFLFLFSFFVFYSDGGQMKLFEPELLIKHFIFGLWFWWENVWIWKEMPKSNKDVWNGKKKVKSFCSGKWSYRKDMSVYPLMGKFTFWKNLIWWVCFWAREGAKEGERARMFDVHLKAFDSELIPFYVFPWHTRNCHIYNLMWILIFFWWQIDATNFVIFCCFFPFFTNFSLSLFSREPK